MQLFNKVKLLIYTYYWKLRLQLSCSPAFKNIIIFESCPNLSDNTKAVFDEMLRRKMNKKYKLVWSLKDPLASVPQKQRNVYYLTPWSYQGEYFEKKAKVKICCNRYLEKNDDRQFCIYLSHGTHLKSTRNYYNIPNWIDYSISQSDKIIDMYSYELNYDKERVIPLGYPRNDVFAKEKVEIRSILNTKCKKIIVWYPTFRNHKNGFSTASTNALPVIHNTEAAKKLNEIARENDILIVLKPHFAQDLSYVKDLKLSNIHFIDDDFFVINNISSYEFVGACDALITDYSSIYYDFTLCNKPIAVIWEDIEEYKKNPGLVDNYDYLTKGAEKIYTLDDFIGFLQRVTNDVDLLKTEREEIRDYVNISTDGKSSERVVNFIIEKANLKF